MLANGDSVVQDNMVLQRL